MSPRLARPTRNRSGSISVTDTFQSVESTNIGRLNGIIQNKGTNDMYIYFGDLATATKDKSFILKPSEFYYLSIERIVHSDEICITGTAGDKYYCAIQ